MALAALQPFEYTATGILGDKRETMLSNELLLRNKLGVPMTRGYTVLPGEGFRYGRPNGVKDGGACDALRGWSNSSSLPFPGKRPGGQEEAPRTERDYMALNRAAVLAGLTTAPENYQFRATHDVRRKVQSDEGKKKMTRRLPPSMVYGISTRPSTPVHELLEQRYQDQWLQERRNTELAKRQKEEIKKLSPSKVYETRASLLRTHQVPVEPAPLWQMPRFSKTRAKSAGAVMNRARPHLETFRSDTAKSLAFKHHQSDCISRKGVFGHGIYEQAKS